MSILDRFGVPGTAAIVTGAGRGLGAATAVVLGAAALAQTDLKLLLAASTSAQLGFVVDSYGATANELDMSFEEAGRIDSDVVLMYHA
uniref:proton-conducting transporter transmembrane domain-containing protein n=1 Tax=Mycolicibacterium poriferae TaxID=39694 RepID=UPI00321C26B9